jgi:hypothetical protein
MLSRSQHIDGVNLSFGSVQVCVIVQTHLLNKAMQLGGTMSVFPVFEVWNLDTGQKLRYGSDN